MGIKKLNSDQVEEDTNVVEEKTSVVRGATFNDHLAKAAKIPPSIVMLVGPVGYVGKQWPIEKEDLIIGRSLNSGVFVDDKSVSKSHSKISFQNGEVILVDLESTNKTIINGRPVSPFTEVRLNNNDQVKVGNVLFKFLEEGSLEAVANRTLNKKSEKDPLTKAFNKGALIAKGPEAVKRAKLMGTTLSVLIFDIDHFKKINDTYSHAAGDYVLQSLSGLIINQLIRGDDFFARFGGEEFVILLFGSQTKHATTIAERIRSTIEKHSFCYKSDVIPVRVSLGIANLSDDINNWDDLFSKADAALYNSKRTGRNKITVAR